MYQRKLEPAWPRLSPRRNLQEPTSGQCLFQDIRTAALKKKKCRGRRGACLEEDLAEKRAVGGRSGSRPRLGARCDRGSDEHMEKDPVERAKKDDKHVGKRVPPEARTLFLRAPSF